MENSLKWKQDIHNLSRVGVRLNFTSRSEIKFLLETDLINVMVQQRPCAADMYIKLSDSDETEIFKAVDFSKLIRLPVKGSNGTSAGSEVIGKYSLFNPETQTWIGKEGAKDSPEWFDLRLPKSDIKFPDFFDTDAEPIAESIPEMNQDYSQPIVRNKKKNLVRSLIPILAVIIVMIAAAAYFFFAKPPTGAVMVSIKPDQSVLAGAKWRVNAGEWQNSGVALSELSVGTYAVEFKAVDGWIHPAMQQVTISKGNTTAINVSYSPVVQTGVLNITLRPDEAVQSGAKWRISGRSWQESGKPVSEISAGIYKVEFKPVDGWVTPANQSIEVIKQKTKSLDAVYRPSLESQISTLTVTITPPEAVQAGAQWRIEGWDWQDSGSNISSLLPGDYSVVFKNIPGWQKPSADIQITKGGKFSAEGKYIK